MATGTTNVGFEEKLWQAADNLRSNMDAAEYKHVVLGLIFLKYVSDSFEEKYKMLKAEGYGDEEDRDEYIADNIFWVPKEARWTEIKAYANSPNIGKVIDTAMESMEEKINVIKYQLEVSELNLVERMGSAFPVLLILVDLVNKTVFRFA